VRGKVVGVSQQWALALLSGQNCWRPTFSPKFQLVGKRDGKDCLLSPSEIVVGPTVLLLEPVRAGGIPLNGSNW
jgi:hypothetical protein